MFKLTDGGFGALVGAAAWIGEAQIKVKQKMRMKRIEHRLASITPHTWLIQGLSC
jgi:hypothetical protein